MSGFAANSVFCPEIAVYKKILKVLKVLIYKHSLKKFT